MAEATLKCQFFSAQLVAKAVGYPITADIVLVLLMTVRIRIKIS